MEAIKHDVEELLRARTEKKLISDELKDINKDLKLIEGRIIMALDNAGIKTVKYDELGVSVTRSSRAAANPEPRDDNSAMLTYLEESGYGDVIKRIVNPQTLSGIVRDWLADGETVIPACINVYHQDVISVRKNK